jgi:hypothetical protein
VRYAAWISAKSAMWERWKHLAILG